MFTKILSMAVLAMCTQAQYYPKEQATSYASFSASGHEADSVHLSPEALSLTPYAYLKAVPLPVKTLQNYQVPSVAGVSDYEPKQEEKYGPAKYAFKYGVEDRHTGDIKSHEETRDGDIVKGQYSLHEPDGTVLTVKYSVEKDSGFNAVVERTGKAKHPEYKASVPAPVSSPLYEY